MIPFIDRRLSRVVLSIAGAVLGAAGHARAAQPIGCLIEPRQVVELGSPVIGVIENMLVERGSAVRKGQVVATLKADVERAAASVAESKAQAEADVRAAIANRDYNEQKLARAEDLVKKGFISPQALEQAKTEYDVAEQKLAQAREQKRIWDREHEMARAQLSLRSLVSPINGIVVDRYLSPGERVEDKPVMKLADTNPLRVELFMPSASYHDIVPGMTAKVYPELPKAGEREARVVHVDRIVDPASNTFRVRLELPNPNNSLPAGLRCKVAIGGTTVGGGLEPAKNPRPARSAAGVSTAAPRVATSAPSLVPAQAAVASAPPPADPAVNGSPREQDIREAVEAWRKAWLTRDFPAYVAAYVPDHKGRAASRESWLHEREARIGRAEQLDIRIDELVIEKLSENKARARFSQSYRSAGYGDRVRKSLVLVRRDGKWLIEAERVE